MFFLETLYMARSSDEEQNEPNLWFINYFPTNVHGRVMSRLAHKRLVSERREGLYEDLHTSG
jgi:hypothetical protein